MHEDRAFADILVNAGGKSSLVVQANGAKKVVGYIVVGGIRCRYFPDNP